MFYSYITKTIITTLIIASSVISSVNVNAQMYESKERDCQIIDRIIRFNPFGKCKVSFQPDYSTITLNTAQSNPLTGSCSQYMFNRTGLGLVNTIYLTQSNTKVKITSCNTVFNKTLKPISVQISNCRNQKLDQDNFDDCEETNSYSYDYKNLRKAQIKTKPVEKYKAKVELKNSLNKASNCVYYILKNKSTTKTCYPVLATTSRMMLLKTNGDLSVGDERYIPIYKDKPQYDRIWVANNRTSTKQK